MMVKDGVILLLKFCLHLSGIISNHHRNFYCLNCFHSYYTRNKLKKYERVCNNHDFCHVAMPKEH